MLLLETAGFDDRNPYWKKPLSRTTTHAIALIVSGKLCYRIDGETLRLNKGKLIHIPPGCLREGFPEMDDQHQKYWATFSTVEDHNIPFPLLERHTPFVVQARQHEYLKQRFSLLVQQWMGKLPYFDSICEAILTEIVGLMNREANELRHPSAQLDIVSEVQRYILTHYREDIQVKEVAPIVGISPNYLSSIFRRLTGSTVKEYVNQVKLSAARDLLLSTNVTIWQAAEYVGFCDQSYFNLIFKKVYGFPPSALRKETRK
ncbi:MAG: hypothetical protein K0R67_1999 [Paenibacillus sp.]|jgi:AraC-like DNA-binding protein|nr:hypothetical protein [Paenibacillus sp.]